MLFRSVLTAVMAATVLTGCGSTDNGTASTTAGSAAQTEAVASTDGKVYNIGICQLVEHEDVYKRQTIYRSQLLFQGNVLSVGTGA